MTDEMNRVIRNIPVTEIYGRYIVRAYYGMGIPVLSVYRVDDDMRSVQLGLDLMWCTATVTPSLLCRDTDAIWDTVLGLLHECGTCDERNRIVQFESSNDLIRGIDHFLELLKTL